MNESLPFVARTSDDITSQGVVALVRMIRAGELSSREVVEAHIRRIEVVNQSLNAIVVPLFEDAVKSASFADEMQARGQVLGSLHGLPVTIKEMFDVSGTPTTAGLTSLANTPASEDAPLVMQLRRAGAIVLGKTNVPQLGMFYESDNPLYGRTNNPWNFERATGGSSGGEAAIIAAQGSPLGLGSDGGGSIRQPAHACGICGIKPTSRRFTMRGHFPCPNWHSDWLQPGPLARSVADLRLALRALSASENDEADATRLPFLSTENGAPSVKSLRIGFYVDDGFFAPAPAVKRAVKAAISSLRDGGAEVEEFCPPNLEEGLRIYFSLFLADGMAWTRRQIKGSRPDWRTRALLWGALVPTLLHPGVKWLNELLGQRYLARMTGWCNKRELSVAEYWQRLEEQNQYRSRFMAEFAKRNLDAIVCPANALPAFPHGTFYGNFTGSYTLLYNLLGMPAGVVPATRVRADEESDRKSTHDAVIRTAVAVERGSADLPIGVQVVARHWREDIALRVMAALEEHFKIQPDFPAFPAEVDFAKK